MREIEGERESKRARANKRERTSVFVLSGVTCQERESEREKERKRERNRQIKRERAR